jgi:hypothetical protein
MSSIDDDRIAYLAGDDDKSLTAQERADLDELRAVLRSSAAWVEPDPGLEDRVVAAVAAESATLAELSKIVSPPPKLPLKLRSEPAD